MKSLSLASLAVTLSTLAVLALPLLRPLRRTVIRCESQNNRERVQHRLAQCAAGPPAVRQRLRRGRTWGSRNGSIWVSNGCRAEFVEARGGWGGGNGGGWGGNNGRPGETIRCESQSNRERSCPVGWRNARLVRQLSGSPATKDAPGACATARSGSATAAAPSSPRPAAGAAAVAGAAATAIIRSPAAATTTARRTATGMSARAGRCCSSCPAVLPGRPQLGLCTRPGVGEQRLPCTLQRAERIPGRRPGL